MMGPENVTNCRRVGPVVKSVPAIAIPPFIQPVSRPGQDIKSVVEVSGWWEPNPAALYF